MHVSEVNPPVFKITSARQLRVIADPVRTAIFEAMCDLAPCGVAELATRLDRSPESLHYHLRKMMGIGLVHIVDHEATGGRKRAVYDLVSQRLQLDAARQSRELRRARAEVASTFLRLTERQLREAIVREKGPTPVPDRRTVRIERELVSISSRDLKRLNSLLDEIHQLCDDANHRGAGAEHRIALTIALCPES